jgi:uncharacterized Rossmann fold enzyme
VADDIIPGLIDIQTKVREFFAWEYQSDLLSANLMAESLNSENPLGVEIWSPRNRLSQFDKLKQKLLDARVVVVVGASVSADDFVGFDFENSVVIAADGSIGGVVELADVACVVTDFDGNPYLDKAAEAGTVFIAHAHGDNISQWQECLDKWRILQNPPALILSHQINETIDGMYNYGGFTDGDRAVCLAIGLGVPVEKISLIGFSTTKIGKWSGQTNPEKKLEKLAWMLQVLKIIGLDEQVESNVYEGI